jgi:hypothetical protein
MARTRLSRWLLIPGAIVVLLAAAGLAGVHFATKALKSQVEAALGADAEVGSITLGFSSIDVEGVRIKGPKGWPAEDALRARRIVIVPELADLLSAKVRLKRIEVDDAYLSVLRTREGTLRLLPSLLEKPAAPGEKGGGVPVTIGTVLLKGGALELFDATLRTPPHKVRLENLQAKIDDIRIPELTGKTGITIDGTIKGVQHNGSLSIKGWAEIASKDSEIAMMLKGVDMLALQPYLIKAAETGVKRGQLDLDIKSSVKKNQLRAPGNLTLIGLELAPSGGTFGTFMGVPRQAAIGALKDRNGRINIQFTLEGNITDPKFSLNESLAMRMGSSVAGVLGISVEGLAKGVGGAAEGVGSAVRKLFGK